MKELFGEHLRRWALLLCVFAFASPCFAEGVTRGEVIAIAESYRTHEWAPTGQNVLHGADARGIHVDTPDAQFRPAGTRPGWWLLGQVNVGVPYQWGGFCSVKEFDAGLRAGKAAGDIYTLAKRAGLDSAVSHEAVGIDCSGFISRCWKLDLNYSTRTLSQLCTAIGPAELRAGDILNQDNAHVLLFVRFLDESRRRIVSYETGCPPTWKVILTNQELQPLLDRGYRPLRYRAIREK
jgi:hypothetical protein